MPTPATIKADASDQLKKDQGSVSVPLRDRQFNRARRKYFGEKKWSWLQKKGSTLTFTSKTAPLPADFDYKHVPDCVYLYSGTQKKEFMPVDWSEVDSYWPDTAVYALDKQGQRIKTNQSDATAYLDYQYVPADVPVDASEDDEAEPYPDGTAVTSLLIAYYWLAKERSVGKHQMFLEEYERQLELDLAADADSEPWKPLNFGRRNPAVLPTSERNTYYGR